MQDKKFLYFYPYLWRMGDFIIIFDWQNKTWPTCPPGTVIPTITL
jgi:hypothetical protein